LIVGDRPALRCGEDILSLLGELMEFTSIASVKLLVVDMDRPIRGDGCGFRWAFGHVDVPW